MLLLLPRLLALGRLSLVARWSSTKSVELWMRMKMMVDVNGMPMVTRLYSIEVCACLKVDILIILNSNNSCCCCCCCCVLRTLAIILSFCFQPAFHFNICCCRPPLPKKMCSPKPFSNQLMPLLPPLLLFFYLEKSVILVWRQNILITRIAAASTKNNNTSKKLVIACERTWLFRVMWGSQPGRRPGIRRVCNSYLVSHARPWQTKEIGHKPRKKMKLMQFSYEEPTTTATTTNKICIKHWH